MFSFHVNRLQTSELQEKVEALLKKNPPPSSEERQVHHVMLCHATTSMPQLYQPSDMACEPGRTSLEMTDSLLRPGDHDDLGGVEKAEGSQCRHGGLFGSRTYRNLRIQKITGKKHRRLVHDD